MFRNYFKIAWRILPRNKVYAIANILGLSLGICACISIYVITSYELSFDTFHPGKEHIYRVMGDVTESSGEKLHFARIPVPVSQTIRREVSGIESVAGIIPYNARISIPGDRIGIKNFNSRIENTHFITTGIAEPQYFQIFNYKWLAGNAATALTDPFTVVLSENKAHQYFGNEAPDKIIGKQIIYDDSLTVLVTGIVKDWDKNTDLGFTDFISFATLQSSFLRNNFSSNSWAQGDMASWVFAKLSPGIDPSGLKDQMNISVKKNAGPAVKLALWPEPLADIHFNADVIENPIRTAHLPTLYSLMAIALFILILAVINFINLSTAQSILRAKEVGIRKVLGSGRINLAVRFLGETFLLVLMAALLAVCMVNPVLLAFSTFIPDGVSFHLFESSTLIILLTITFVTTLFAGIYPAKVLSSYLPALSLKGMGSQKPGGQWFLRRGLIVFQFAVSLIFIIGSIVITKQLRYTREKDLGFNSNAIIIVESPGGDSLTKVAVLAEKIKHIPGVSNVARQWLSPMTENSRGMKLKFKGTDERTLGVAQVAGDENFIPLYEIKLLAGRNLEKTDTVNEFVINESLSRFMGDKNPQESLGKMLYWNDKSYPVAGVVADFHTSSLHDPITPLCIINRPEREGGIAIKLSSKGIPVAAVKSILSKISQVWKQIYPGTNFNYKFYDESLASLYEKDKQTATLMNAAMLVAIFISCIGLFGLVLFTAETRAKEISIRKILGASVAGITIMLTKDFVKLVIISLFIAAPIGWYFMNSWLNGFAYRVRISGWIFVIAGAVALLIALFTTGFHAIKAAFANPVKNLRRE